MKMTLVLKQRQFYVDNILKSNVNPTRAIVGFHNSIAMCAQGGFRLTKVVSNLREVMKALTSEERGKSFKQLDLSNDVLQIERVLGVEWCIETDTP